MTLQQEQNVPALRFPEFRGAWERTKLGDIATFSKGKGLSKADISDDGVLECIRYGQLYTDYQETIRDVKSRTNIPAEELVLSGANDIIIPASGETHIDIATASCVLKEGVALGGDLNIVKAKHNGIFLSYYLNNKRKYDIARLSQGISVVHLYAAQLAMLHLNLPECDEQLKIASFLSAIDIKIGQLQKKKVLLGQYKKGMMKRLFSQEVRFKDDHGNDFPDWEEKRLGKLVELINGLTYAPTDIRAEGLLVLRSSNVQDGKIDLEDTVFVNLEVDASKQTMVDDILLCVRNGSQRLIGKSAIVKAPLQNATHGAFMSVLRGPHNNFVFQLMQTPLFFREVHKNLGATINSINGSDLKRFKFSIPSHPDEQLKIANFLSAIDKKIDLVATELEQAQIFKKGLLQQMFI